MAPKGNREIKVQGRPVFAWGRGLNMDRGGKCGQFDGKV